MLTRNLFSKPLNLMKIDDMFLYFVLKFYYKYKYMSLPQDFHCMFFTVDTTHDHDTRHAQEQHIAMTKSKPSENLIRNYLPRVLKGYPQQVLSKIETHSYQGFSQYTCTKHAKQFLISKYDLECHLTDCYICTVELV